MALTQQGNTRETPGLRRVQWPDLPELQSLEADDRVALLRFYAAMRETVDRTFGLVADELANKQPK